MHASAESYARRAAGPCCEPAAVGKGTGRRMHDLKELDRARERWRLVRRRLGQCADAKHGSLGLARRTESLSARLLILPGDPFATDLSFDDEFWNWWTADGPSPFGTRVQWTNTTVTIDAAVKYRGNPEEWSTYLGLHRHGGVEIGCDPSWSGSHERRYFKLRQMVGLVWIGAAAQAEVVGRFGFAGPWEMSLVFYQTRNSYLAGLGTGWAEPHHPDGWLPRPQQDPRVMIRRELDTFPSSEDDVRDLAFDVGARIEDAWGISERRFLDRIGDMEGHFNPLQWHW